MKRTITISLNKDIDIENTIIEYNKICNEILSYGFKNRIWNKKKLHHTTYFEIRKKYPKFPSALVVCARDQSADMLKQCKAKKLPVKREKSTVRYNNRAITINLEKNFLTISTINGRKKINFQLPKYFEKYKDWKCQTANVGIKNNRIVLFLVVEKEAREAEKENLKIIGIDRGVYNPVVTSNNLFFNSKEIRRVKGKYQYLRSILQKKGTPSAKRRLKQLSGKEKRFVRCENHKLAKMLVNSDANVFVLEKLNIKRNKENGKRLNKLLGYWAFGQFQKFLEYKAEEVGKKVIYVDAKHTSQICSVCGYIDKANRKGRNFRCVKCGFSLNADLNAARNIANLGNALISRLSVNQPNVVSQDNYKPPVLTGGN